MAWTSAPSAVNPGLATSFSFAPHQNIKDVSPIHTLTNMDPPRAARENHEWVWFPAGYWAERELVEAPSKDITKVFRRRKRSGKSGSASPHHSPKTPHTSPPTGKADKTPDYSARRQTITQRTTSSDSNTSFFRLNRMPADAPLPSPYLTEEAHVQSLQWPSIGAARSSSISGSSMFKARGLLSPSPLQFSNIDDEIEPDSFPLSLPSRQTPTDTSSDMMHLEMPTPKPLVDPEPAPKKPFINWRMLSDHRLRLKKRHTPDDESTGVAITHAQSSPLQNQVISPLRMESSTAEDNPKSLKSRPAKLFTKGRWHRKVSGSSIASTSSSVRHSGSIRSRSPAPTPVSERGETPGMLPAIKNAWDSEYPGNEAMRVQTPCVPEGSLDRFPRSFFSDISAPVQYRHPLSQPEGQGGRKKGTPLSTSFAPDTSSSTSTVRPPAIRKEYQTDTDGHTSRSGTGTGRSVTRDKRRAGNGHLATAPKRNKEWWEVPVSAPVLVPYPRPTSSEVADQRQMLHQTMAANTQRTFKFDLPEHLPTSPMCPANSRHKTGGTGVCVYHGRAKRSRTASSISTENTPTGRSQVEENAAGGDNDIEDEDNDEAGSDVWR
ncbi:hypothetical protein HD806DRAFT_540380 [Xylariaceae sp. AK1471]|nr:hypothetical protein HD806DRAFT_540380 [Xylariaceae sp. AK1471]